MQLFSKSIFHFPLNYYQISSCFKKLLIIIIIYEDFLKKKYEIPIESQRGEILIMKAVIVYHTRSGNTKLLAEKIKDRLESLNITVEVYQDINFKNFDSIKAFDIIGCGSPTHYYNIAKEFREILLKIADFNLRGKKLIVFATGSTKNGPSKICKDITKILSPTEIQVITKIGCVKKPTNEIDLRIKKAISEAILL